jgi:aminopeptidase N
VACFHHTDARALLGLARSERALLGLDPKGASTPFPEPGVGPHYPPSRTFRITHATVALSLEPEARTYRAKVTLAIEPHLSWDGHARLDLAPEVPVHAVTDRQGRPLTWRRTARGIEVEAGRSRTIVLEVGGHTPAAGLYFTGPDAAHPKRDVMAWTQCQDEDAHFFLPCLDHPRIKHPWTVHLDAPEGFTLLSNGARGDEKVRKGRVHATFEQVEPMPAYLFTAVAARLSVFEDKAGKVPLRYLVPVGEEEAVERAFGRTPDMMEAFAAFTGVPYPWPRYDQVVVHEFVFGGMENTACTTMTDLLLVDPKVGPHWDPEPLVAHELAHQWFGDLVTCQDWSQAWLNESWATFMEEVWIRHARGATEADWYAFEHARAYLEEDHGRYRRPIASYLFKEPIDVFDRHLYEKGGVVLRTLRHELGDEAFRAGVARYLEQHGGGSVHGRDFQRALEEATGASLERFFAQWIHGAGHPVLDVHLGEEHGLLTVTVRQTQEGEQTEQAFHFPLVLELVLEKGTTRRVVLPVRERERTWAIPVDGRVERVRVDPDFSVLAEIALDGPAPWIPDLALDPSPVLAVRALQALAKKGTVAAVGAIREALATHPWWGVRAEAAQLLGKRKGEVERDALLARLDAEQEPRALAAVIRALGPFQEPVVAAALSRALEAGPPTWHVHGELLEALGRTRQPGVIATILPHLDVPSWGDLVAQRAAIGLALTEDASVLDTLLAASRAPRGDRALAGIARALGILGDKAGDDDIRRRCRERLEELARHGGFRTQLAALGALGELGDPAASGTLSDLHASAPDGRVRRTAWEALVRVRQGRTGEEALKGVRERLDALADENRKLRDRLDRLDRLDRA